MTDVKKLWIGSGGGAAASTVSTSTPDSLFSEDVVEFALAVSEGPIKGLVEGAKSFYVGGTPLVSQSGTKNFDKFAIGVHPGYPEGSAKTLDLLLGGVTSSQQVGVNLLSNVGVTRLTNAALRGTIDELELRINFQRLVRSGPSGTFPATAEFKIEYKASASASWLNFYDTTTINITGKTTSTYVKEFRVSVPRLSNDDWQVRVTKISPDSAISGGESTDTTYVDMAWESLQATTKTRRAFPNTAIVHGIGVANGQFSSLPDFGGVYDGLLVPIPDNYNPITRTYDESTPWSGNLGKFEWTNNPAWILYDMLTNTRYGLAAHRASIHLNVFDFYLAAKWCDAPVKTGRMVLNSSNVQVEETQPRYTFNDLISDARPIREAIAYVAGSFNALVWDDLSGQIHLKVDKDEPATSLFTPESVTSAGFNYSFTDLAMRANDISVSFINPDLDWNEDRRRIPNYTTDEAAIAKFGRIPLDFIAVGCTNVHEALRKARVRLISAQTETTTVSFTTMRQGALVDLFSVILIADPTMGWSQSGRITGISDGYIHFRDPIYIETMKAYNLKLQTALGLIELGVTPDQLGFVTKLRITQGSEPTFVPDNATFTLEDTGGFGYAKPFRVVSISEVEDSPYAYSITAVEVNRTKYLDAETQTTTPDFQYSYKEPALPDSPQNLILESGDGQTITESTGVLINRIKASWSKPLGSNITSYEVQYKLTTETEWQTISTDTTSAFISPVTAGATYGVRVRSVAPDGNKSSWVQIVSYLVKGKKVLPAAPVLLTPQADVFQITLSWTYPPLNLDLQKIQIFGGATGDINLATQLAEVAYPTTSWVHSGLASNKTNHYWARVQDTSGNLSVFSDAVSATTTKDPAKVLDVLKDAITPGQLIPSLKDRIDLIDGPADKTGTVANQIKAEQDARNTAILAEAAERVAALQAEVANRQAAITQVQTVIQTTTDSLANEVTILSSRIGDNASAILSEQTARTTATTAIAQQLDVLVANVGANQASVTSELVALATKDSAIAADISTLVTRVNNNTASIVAEQTARTTADLAEATSRQQLETDYKAADAQKAAEAKSYVQSYAYSKSDADSAQAALADNLTTSYTAYADAKRTEAVSLAAADVRNYAYSRSDINGAMSTTTSQITAAYKGYADAKKIEAVTEAAADVRNYAYSKADSDASEATLGSTLTSAYKTYADIKAQEAISAAAADVRQHAYSKATSDASLASLSATLTTNYQAYAIGAKNSAVSLANADVRQYSYSKSETEGAISNKASEITAAYTTYANNQRLAAISTANADVREYAYSKAAKDASEAAITTNLTSSIKFYSDKAREDAIADAAVKKNEAIASAAADVRNYTSSKAQIDLAISTKATEITAAYESYADTKKAEAIADAAIKKTEAIAAAAADIRDYANSKATDFLALSTLSTNLTAAYQSYADTKKTEAIASSSAEIKSYSFSKAETTSAIASATTTLSSTVQNHTTTISQHTSSIDGLSGQYSIKVDNLGHVSGFGLSSTAVDGPPTSAFDVRADKFIVTFPNQPTGAVVPFSIGNVNGTAAIGFNGNLMIDGTVSIRNNSGETIFSASTQLDGAYIKQATIETLNLAGNSVTQAVTSTTDNGQIELNQFADTVLATMAAVQITGTQPILVWFSALFAGAHITLGGETANTDIGGTNWTHNTNDSDVTLKARLSRVGGGGTYEVTLATAHTVIKSIGQHNTINGTFAGAQIPTAGTYTVRILGRVGAGAQNIGLRYRTVTLLETKR